VKILPSPQENDNNWIFRIFDRRIVSVKAKNEEVRKVAVIDALTCLPFSLEVPSEVSLNDLEIEKAYNASLKVYTAQNIDNVPSDMVSFFKVLDVDQKMEDFIKAYWLYPKLIRFELTEIEPT
jgi:hypothetical protein